MSGPHEPTAPTQPEPRGRGDTEPPAPPRELPRDETGADIEFDVEGRTWIARLGGKGALGTGSYGLALVEAVHFYDPDRPERPQREALLARGRFDGLYADELRELFARARPVVDAPS